MLSFLPQVYIWFWKNASGRTWNALGAEGTFRGVLVKSYKSLGDQLDLTVCAFLPFIHSVFITVTKVQHFVSKYFWLHWEDTRKKHVPILENSFPVSPLHLLILALLHQFVLFERKCCFEGAADLKKETSLLGDMDKFNIICLHIRSYFCIFTNLSL